jgi:hypothetical protein
MRLAILRLLATEHPGSIRARPVRAEVAPLSRIQAIPGLQDVQLIGLAADLQDGCSCFNA